MFVRLRLSHGDLILREATEADAVAFFHHKQTVLAETDLLLQAPEDFESSEEQERVFLARARHCDAALVLVAATPGGVIVGNLTVFAGPYRRTRHVAQLGMAVERAYWGHGVGRALLDWAIAWAKGCEGVQKLSLQVYASNDRALALYRRAGFEEEGCLRSEVRRDDGRCEDLIVMSLFTA